MKKHLLPIIFIVAAIILWLSVYSKLPERMPIHWDLNGNVNGYTTKLGAMVTLIGIMCSPYLLLVVIPKIDPKKENYPQFSKGYFIINMAILLLLFIINILIILSASGHNIHMGSLISLILGALFIVIGNYLPQIKPNYFMGIRIPWTLNDPTNWKKTHRFGGRIFMIGGFLTVITFFLPNGMTEIALYPILFLIILLPTIYSYLLYKKSILKL
jgi:uncharacterized membrane protein